MITTTRPYGDLRLQSEDFNNPRARTGLEMEEIVTLAMHIGLHGLQVPLRVTADGTITAGQRRYLAIGMIIEWRRGPIASRLAPHEAEVFDRRAADLAQGVPCVLDESTDAGERLALAIGNNLLSQEMASYDVDEHVMALVERGYSHQRIADWIGRTRPYVTKMVGAWRGACPDLRAAWASGQVPYTQVQVLADLPANQQRLALAAPPDTAEPAPLVPRGPHGRPGVDALKHLLRTTRSRPEAAADPYLRGIIDTLKVACGEVPIDDVFGEAAAAGS